MRGLKGLMMLGVLVILAGMVTSGKAAELGEGEGVFKEAVFQKLPSISLDGQALGKEDLSYLGLKKGGSFTVGDLKADLVLIEFLNVYCYACNMQAPVMNQVFQAVQNRPDLKDRVRFLGVGAGNYLKEVNQFRERFDGQFPIVPDPHFTAYDSIGTPGGTPFLLIYAVKIDEKERAVASAHLGVMRNVDRFVEEMEFALGTREREVEISPYEFRLGEWRNLKPDLSEAEVTKKLKAAGAEVGFKAADIEKVSVEEEEFYRLKSGDGKMIWAKIAGRAKICNVCHDLFFIILFDENGTIINFIPIHVTKYKNVDWDEKDNAFMKNRVIGRSLLDPVVFDPEVDAVSTATMSSELIFDTIRRLSESYQALKKAALIKP